MAGGGCGETRVPCDSKTADPSSHSGRAGDGPLGYVRWADAGGGAMAAPGMNPLAWSRLPRFTAAGQECVSRLRESASQRPVCEAGEDALASWLWLLVRAGHVRPQEVRRAMAVGREWHGLLALARRGGERLVDAMARIAIEVVPEAVASASGGWWLGLRTPMDSGSNVSDAMPIELVGCAALDVTVDFTALPPPLAAAVLETLWLIRAMLPIGLGIEIFEQSPWAEERRGDYERLSELGLSDDPAGALEALRRGELSILEAENVADMADILAEGPNWMDSECYWPDRPKPGAPGKRAEELLALTASWRSERNELNDDPWVPFIEQVAGYMRGRDDLPEWFFQRAAVLPLDEMQVDLSVACFVLTKNPAEVQMLYEDRESASQTGCCRTCR